MQFQLLHLEKQIYFWICLNFFYCCSGWRYIVAFTKVLTMYQIYYTWIHPPLLSYISPPLISCNSFNRYHFCIYIHVYTLFATYSPSYHFSPPPPHFHWCKMHPPKAEPVPLILLFSKFVKKIYIYINNKKRNMTFLLVWDKDV
jgi:hypothetical protein